MKSRAKLLIKAGRIKSRIMSLQDDETHQKDNISKLMKTVN